MSKNPSGTIPDAVAPIRERKRRRRAAIGALVAGTIGSAVLALSATGTLSAFVAAITNNNNTATTGILKMRETLTTGPGGTTATCNSTDGTGNSVGGSNTSNTANCSTINKYGGNGVSTSSTDRLLTPGVSVATVIKIENTGTVDARLFTLKAGTCTAPGTAPAQGQGTATDLCDKITITVTYKVGSGAASTVVPLQTLTALATATTTNAMTLNGTTPVKPVTATGTPDESVTLTITVKLDDNAGNTYQGQTAKQDLTWTFSS